MTSPLFSYRKADTPLHKIPAIVKLAAQFVICIALFAKPHSRAAEVIIQLFCGVIIAASFVAAKIKIRDLKKLSFVLVLGAFYAVFRVFSVASPALQENEGYKLFYIHTDRIADALLYIYRFFMGTLSAMIFFETTSSLQIKAAFEQLQEAIAKIFPPLRKLNPALTISLAINFIPQIFSTWNRIDRAAKARMPKGKKAAFFVKSLYAELTALLSCLISHAETTRRAIVNRSAAEAQKGKQPQ